MAAARPRPLQIAAQLFVGGHQREPYAQLRRAFVYKHKPAKTPPHLARQQIDRRSAA